jgi:hypothetical protein
MLFLYLNVDDEPSPLSMRGFIERNAIALLSNYNNDSLIDLPSKDWLGRWARSKEIKRSGLWNVNHVSDSYCTGFTDELNHLLSMM